MNTLTYQSGKSTITLINTCVPISGRALHVFSYKTYTLTRFENYELNLNLKFFEESIRIRYYVLEFK